MESNGTLAQMASCSTNVLVIFTTFLRVYLFLLFSTFVHSDQVIFTEPGNNLTTAIYTLVASGWHYSPTVPLQNYKIPRFN